MIGQIVTGKDGQPLDQNGNAISASSYQPSDEVKKLFARCQKDYQIAYNLQNRSFDEFDGLSLLQRTKVDQETFAAYVGIEQSPVNKAWRWKGRKNTARNKIIAILAHLLSAMLYPYVTAYNDENDEDATVAKVARMLIENHLKKADYEIKFLFMILSALVNPAIFAEVEYVEALQRIKTKMSDGTYKVEEAVDDLLSGIGLNLIGIDQLLLGDFYTFDLQRQPFLVKVRRISYDEARGIYGNKYFINGVDQFDYVRAGMTKIVLAGSDNQTLFDVDWTETDQDYVQVLTFYYRPEDLEVTFVGGVFMGEEKDIYNSNPFKHRRMSMIGNDWKTVPVYPFAKSGFEPIDPAMRFAYYKSAAFKEFWDDAAQNKMHQLAFDGTSLDVMKPLFMSGVASVDDAVIVPGATIAMPMGASVTPYQLGPNLQAALTMMRQQTDDMAESTQDQIMSGITQKGVTAYAVSKAEQNAKVILGVFGVMVANLVKQIGELVLDDIIAHTTIGEIDATIPESLKMKFKTIMLKGKDNGKDVTNKIQFDSGMIGRNMSEDDMNKMAWKLFYEAGGADSKDRIWKVNPYKFARHQFSVFIDPDIIVSRSMGTDQLKNDRAFAILTDPRVAPYVDQETVVDKFVLEEYSDGDPDQFKKKPEAQNNDMLAAMMGGGVGGGQTATPQLPVAPQ